MASVGNSAPVAAFSNSRDLFLLSTSSSSSRAWPSAEAVFAGLDFLENPEQRFKHSQVSLADRLIANSKSAFAEVAIKHSTAVVAAAESAKSLVG